MTNILGVPRTCPGPDPCGHTILEHLACDAGLAAALQGVGLEACPFDDEVLYEAWMVGHSVNYEVP